MKKYRFLKAGERIEVGDEEHLGGWSAIHPDDDNLIGYEIDDDDVGFFRRPIPHTGNVQFLMQISILVPVMVACDGMTQEEIEDRAAEMACQKILSDPEWYIMRENVDWENCKVDEIQPEPGNTGEYRMLEEDEIIMAGDEYTAMGKEEWKPVSKSIGEPLPKSWKNSIRRPITNEPQYRPFKEGDVIEGGDLILVNKNPERWEPCLIDIGKSPHKKTDFRKLIK